MSNDDIEEFRQFDDSERQAHLGVNELLAQMDNESERFRNKIIKLMAKTVALHKAEQRNDLREDLVLRLREANQNLVLSTLDAQAMQAKAEGTSARQIEFLSMLAHELRNPMAPIALACEMLRTLTDAHPQLPRLHQIMNRQITHMTHLVDDLMDASRISTGKITLNRDVILLSDIIDSAIETTQPIVDKRHQTLTVALPAAPIFLNADMVRLAQVFSNLIINASKFSPDFEHISVSVRAFPDSVHISLKDNGIGIEAKMQPLIFDLFTQGFTSLDRPQGGLGIGLSLARTIVAMHGGTIKVYSAGVGQGSEFIVMLLTALEPAPPVTLTAPESVRNRSCRILVVDDFADITETLTDLLEAAGHIVSAASDGPTGLAMAKANRYDVIVCDIGLPGIDGYGVAEELRLSTLQTAPCLIAMSGYDQPENRSRALEAGFDFYLVKPIVFATLADLIASIVPR